jgi:glycosyltransferase involved in cell wall biosynthesis
MCFLLPLGSGKIREIREFLFIRIEIIRKVLIVSAQSVHKILFILSRDPWESKNGRNSLLLNIFETLNQRFGADIYLAFLVEPNKEKIPPYIKDYFICSPISGAKKAWNVLTKSLFCHWSLQDCLFYSHRRKKEIRKYAEKVKPDVVFFDMIRTLPYYRSFKSLPESQLVMDLDDLLSERYKKTYSNINKQTNIFGESARSVGKVAKFVSSNMFLKKRILKYEIRRVLRSEKKSASLFSKVTFVSNNETQEFNKRYQSDKGCILPMCVDYDYLSQTINNTNNNRLCFVGNYNYGPNADSVKLICENILPLLKSDYQMVFIGQVSDELKLKYENDKVKFLGLVKDLRTEVGNSLVFLSPISYGSGIKTKIVEALAMGKCVVTNSVGFENLNAQPGRDILVIDDSKEMAAKVDELMNDKTQVQGFEIPARKVAKDNYTFAVLAEALQSIMQKNL